MLLAVVTCLNLTRLDNYAVDSAASLTQVLRVVMTRHRLVRSQAAILLGEVTRRYAGSKRRVAGTSHPEAGAVGLGWVETVPLVPPCVGAATAHALGPPPPAERWADWWLEVQQGANGVPVHLSAGPSPHAPKLMTSRVSQREIETSFSSAESDLDRRTGSCPGPDNRPFP